MLGMRQPVGVGAVGSHEEQTAVIVAGGGNVDDGTTVGGPSRIGVFGVVLGEAAEVRAVRIHDAELRLVAREEGNPLSVRRPGRVRVAGAAAGNAAREGKRAPVQVMEGNYKLMSGTCAWWDGVKQ